MGNDDDTRLTPRGRSYFVFAALLATSLLACWYAAQAVKIGRYAVKLGIAQRSLLAEVLSEMRGAAVVAYRAAEQAIDEAFADE